MPWGDGTGPPGGGGRGTGGGRGGRMGGTRAGAGPGGNCICPRCGEKLSHKQGTPCNSISCPKCSIGMIRE